MRQEWGYCLPSTRPLTLTDLYPSPCILTEASSNAHLGASSEASQSSHLDTLDRVLEFGNLCSWKGNQAREGLGEGEGEWRSGEDRPPGLRDDRIGGGSRVTARCADSADDVAMAGSESSCSKHPHALALVAACALRGQPAALYVLHALRARTAAPSAPAAPTGSQKRDPTTAAATARVAQAVARQGIEEAVLGEVVADGHVCRRLHYLAARLLAAAPAAADAAWAAPRVPADVDCQLASVPCPLAACRMVQQAADAGSAGGNACGDAAADDVGSDGEGSDWDSESGDVWMGWTGGESDDDESEGGEEGGERAESALLKSSSQHPLPPPQHPHDHATPRSQRGEPRLEGGAVGAGGAGAEGDDAVLRGFGRALLLVLAQYEAGVAQLARTCVASLSASPPTAARDRFSSARSQAASPAGPSDAVLLLAMQSRRLRAQLRRLVVLLGMDSRGKETAGGEGKGQPWEGGALKGKETAGGKVEDEWSVVYHCPQMLMAGAPDLSSSGMRGMPLTPPPPHTPHTHHMHLTPHTHHTDRAVAASGGSRAVIPSQMISPSQFDTPRFLSNQAAAGDARSAAFFLRPCKGQLRMRVDPAKERQSLGKEREREQICSGCGWSHEPSWHAPGDDVAAADWPWKGNHPPPLSNLLAVQISSNESARFPAPTALSSKLQKAWVECGAMLRLTDPRSGPAFPWTWMACNEGACSGDGCGGGVVHGASGISWHAVLQHASIHGGCAVEHAWRHGEGGVEHAQGRGSKGVAKGGIEGAKGATERSKEGGKDGGIRGDKEGSKEGAKEGTKEGVKEGEKEGSEKGAAAGSGRRKQKGVEVQSGKHSGRQRSGQSGKQGGPGRQHSGRPGEKQSEEPGGKAGGRGAAAGRGGGHVTDEERRLVGMAVTDMDGSFDDAMHAHLLLPIRASHALVSRAAVQVLFTVGRYRDHCTALHRLFLSPHSALPSAVLHALHAVDWASLRSLPEQQHALSSALDTAISQACLSSLPSASLSRLHAFISPSSLSSSAFSSISSPPPHPMSPGVGGGGVGSASKQLTWSPLSAHRLGAFDFVRVGYDPGWPASVVITPPLLQQYADILAALLRLHHVQRAVENLTVHVKTPRMPASVVRRPNLVQQYGDTLTALIRLLQHVQRAISSLTIHIKVHRAALHGGQARPSRHSPLPVFVRPPVLFPSFPPPSMRAAQLVSCMLAFMSAQLQRAVQHGDQILLLGTQAEHKPHLVGLGLPWDLFSFQEAHAQFLLYCTTRCLLDARSAPMRERLDSLLQLVLDVHRSVDSARMVAPLSKFFLDDDAPIWEEVEEQVGEFNEALNDLLDFLSRKQEVSHKARPQDGGDPKTELDRRLEAALRAGDHAAAQQVNEAIMRRESVRRQRQAEWQMQLATSLQVGRETQSEWHLQVAAIRSGVHAARQQSCGQPATWRSFREECEKFRGEGPRVPGARTLHPISCPYFPNLLPFSPAPPASTPFPPPSSSRLLPAHPPRLPLAPRTHRAFSRSPGDVVSRGVDRAFTELAELDQSETPGSDGRQVINVPELYTGILIVYESTGAGLGGYTAVTAGNVAAAREGLFGERCWASGSALSPWRSAALRGHSMRRGGDGRATRGVEVTATWDVVSRGVDRAFTELSELDETPGSDGRQVINVPELYTGILIVYDRHVRSKHANVRLTACFLVQDYDINHDGVLDREEFGELVRHFARTVVVRVLLNLVVIFSLVPLLVSLAKKLAHKRSFLAPPLRSITLHHVGQTTHAAQATPAAQATIPVTPLVFFDVVNARSSLRPILFLPSPRTLVLSSSRVTSVTFCFRTVMIRLTCNIAKIGDSGHLFAQQKNLLPLPLDLGP
ncbi:unnamed protein product [Closterium sp. Naga37s-1]|nr:unnamed protein product [Closterium sp. Naga37s-1]